MHSRKELHLPPVHLFFIIISAYHSDQANTERPSVSYSAGCVDNKLQPSSSKGVTPLCKMKALLLPALTDPALLWRAVA